MNDSKVPLPSALELKQDVFFRRQISLLAGILLVGGLALLSGIITRFNTLDAFRAFPKAMIWMGTSFMPNADVLGNLPKILDKLGQTILVAIMASVHAAAFAFLLAVLGSSTTGPHPAVTWLIRFIASFLRNIPLAAWAMIFLFSFRQSSFTGFLAIFVQTLGFLTRAYMEAIDETSASSVEALKASGASRVQTIFQAVLPGVLPQLVSWLLYMIDTNIRSSTLVGILTGTGIGFVFNMYYRNMQYPAAGLTVLAIVLSVILIEALSNALRRLIL